MFRQTILNISTGNWIRRGGSSYRVLLKKGYKYVEHLSDYMEEHEYEYFDPLADFEHPAMLPPLWCLIKKQKEYDLSLARIIKKKFNKKKIDEWKEDIITRFLRHTNPTHSKNKLNAILQAFVASNTFQIEYIITLALAFR